MSTVLKIALPASLLLAALLVSACATQQEAAPAPVAPAAPIQAEAVVEQPSAPQVVAETTPVPAAEAVAEQPQVRTQAPPKKAVQKAKKAHSKPAPPQAPKPAPVVEATPIVSTALPNVVQAEPTPTPAITPADDKLAVEPGFFEQYWMWLIGLIVIIAGVVLWRLKNRE